MKRFLLLKKYIIISVLLLILIVFTILFFNKKDQINNIDQNPNQPQNQLSFKTIDKAGLLFAPTEASFYIGDTITVALFVNAPGQPINFFEGNITFPQDKLQVTNLSTSGSIIKFWVQKPSFSNQNGTVALSGGLPSPSFTGVVGKLIILNFKVKSEGIAVINMKDARLLANDGYGTDILANVIITHLNLLKTTRPIALGDFDGDGKVDLTDVSILLANFGTKNNKYDLNSDGKVDGQDFSILLSRWSR